MLSPISIISQTLIRFLLKINNYYDNCILLSHSTKLVNPGMWIIVIKTRFLALAVEIQGRSSSRVFLSTRRQNRDAWKGFRSYSGRSERMGKDARKRELTREWRRSRARDLLRSHTHALRSAPSPHPPHRRLWMRINFIRGRPIHRVTKAAKQWRGPPSCIFVPFSSRISSFEGRGSYLIYIENSSTE